MTRGATTGALRSGGLGLSREEWERRHGPARRVVADRASYGEFYIAGFADGRVNYLERFCTGGDPCRLPRAEARALVLPLLPADAVAVRSYATSTRLGVDLYRSDALAVVFPPERFAGGQPGEFTVLFVAYASAPDLVLSVQVKLGNTPNTAVQRDGSGNFAAGTITGTLAGNATTAQNAVNAQVADKLDGYDANGLNRIAAFTTLSAPNVPNNDAQRSSPG